MHNIRNHNEIKYLKCRHFIQMKQPKKNQQTSEFGIHAAGSTCALELSSSVLTLFMGQL